MQASSIWTLPTLTWWSLMGDGRLSSGSACSISALTIASPMELFLRAVLPDFAPPRIICPCIHSMYTSCNSGNVVPAPSSLFLQQRVTLCMLRLQY